MTAVVPKSVSDRERAMLTHRYPLLWPLPDVPIHGKCKTPAIHARTVFISSHRHMSARSCKAVSCVLTHPIPFARGTASAESTARVTDSTAGPGGTSPVNDLIRQLPAIPRDQRREDFRHRPLVIVSRD